MPAFDWYLIWLLGPIYLGFAVASFFLALMVGQKLKRRRLVAILAALFLPLPLMLIANETWPRASAEVAWRYYEHLCETYAGDKIYRTVDGVQGIFQMRPKDPKDYQKTDSRWAMEDPYGYAARHDRLAHLALADTSGPPRYRFVESPRPDEVTNGPPYARHELVPTGRLIKRYQYVEVAPDVELKRVSRQVDTLESRYGYSWQDLTTPVMRGMWVGGGKIIVVDLRTKDVIAERTGFMFARSRTGTRNLHAWASARNLCPRERPTFYDFIIDVLPPDLSWYETARVKGEL